MGLVGRLLVVVLVALVLWGDGAVAEAGGVFPRRRNLASRGRELQFTMGLPSAFVGIHGLTTLAQMSFVAKDVTLGPLTQSCHGVWRVLCGLGHAAEVFFADFAIASYTNMLLHEVFGHGARARELGLRSTYTFSAPMPYALVAGGFGNRIGWQPADALRGDERHLLVLGGVQAEEEHLRALAWGSFRSGVVHHGDALMYMLGIGHLLTLYLGEGADTNNHLRLLAQRYPRAATGKERDALRWSALVAALLDPFFISGFYSLFRFLVEGRRLLKLPQIPFRRSQFYWSLRVLPVPWGREYILRTMLGTRWFNTELSFRVGLGPGEPSFAFSARVADVWLGRYWRVGAGLDLFLHPRLALPTLQGGSLPTARATTTPAVEVPTGRIGGIGGYLELTFIVERRFFFGLRVNLKTEGLVVAQPYGANAEFLLTFGFLLPRVDGRRHLYGYY